MTKQYKRKLKKKIKKEREKDAVDSEEEDEI